MLLTAEMEAKGERDVMVLDMNSAFLQSSSTRDETAEEMVRMKLRGILVDIKEKFISPKAHSKFVTHQNDTKCLRVRMLKPLSPRAARR